MILSAAFLSGKDCQRGLTHLDSKPHRRPYHGRHNLTRTWRGRHLAQTSSPMFCMYSVAPGTPPVESRVLVGEAMHVDVCRSTTMQRATGHEDQLLRDMALAPKHAEMR